MRIKGFWPLPVSEGPNTVEERKAFLRKNLTETIPDAWFPSKQKAVDAAKRFERGERIDGGWDPAEFFASWVPGKNPDRPEDEGWLVVFGCRDGIPEQWETYWASFNARRASRTGVAS